jgi:hypothetical protein
MTQPTQRLAQRRRNTLESGTCTFWYRRPHAVEPVSAWMLNRSAEEAAFLTSAGDAPRVGERLELAEVDRGAQHEPGSASGAGPHLPRFGRVVRLDEPQGTTRRVAIRFEPSPRSSLISTGP